MARHAAQRLLLAVPVLFGVLLLGFLLLRSHINQGLRSLHERDEVSMERTDVPERS